MSKNERLDAMQDSEQPQPRLPPIGPNKLQQAMDDYDHMTAERDHLQKQVKELSDIANKTVAENEALKNQIKAQDTFFTQQIATITARRDRLERLAKGLLTRFKMIRECFDAAEVEASMESLTLDESQKSAIETDPEGVIAGTTAAAEVAETPEDDITPEDEQALQDLALHDPARRTILPPVVFR